MELWYKAAVPVTSAEQAADGHFSPRPAESTTTACSTWPWHTTTPRPDNRRHWNHALRLLHHHGGAVFFVACRQRAAGSRDRTADADAFAGMDDAAAQVLVHD